MDSLKILDCTLRDGGYVNNWSFPQSQILKIIESLEASNVDIIELGYLNDSKGKERDSTLFNSMNSIGRILNGVNKSVSMVVMIDLFAFDVDQLPKKSDTEIDGIRLAFHKRNIGDALLVAQKIIDLG